MSPGRTIYAKLDWILILCYILLAVFGWLNIYASTYSEGGEGMLSLATRSGNQLMWIGIAVVTAFVIIFVLGSRFWRTVSWPLYGLSILMLAAVLLFGHEVNGSRSWLTLPGGFAIQPSEFSKIATALCLSRIMGSYGFKVANTEDFLKVAAVIVVPVGLIVLEPDVGTVLVYCSLVFVLYREGLPGKFLGFAGLAILLFLITLRFSPSVSMLITAGVTCATIVVASRHRIRAAVISAAAITAAAFIPRLLRIESVASLHLPAPEYWILGLMVIAAAVMAAICIRKKIRGKPHHRDRIENLLGISEDPMGAGYNVNQSRIAIGSGGLTGKGFLQGTQTKFNFVPEQSTDFIFCTIGEEWGFVGSIAVLAVFLIMIMRIVTTAERQKDRSIRVYGYCVASYLFMHVFVNIGMTTGIMPVIGIPLPLISYGGSSFLTFTILLFIYIRFDLERWK